MDEPELLRGIDISGDKTLDKDLYPLYKSRTFIVEALTYQAVFIVGCLSAGSSLISVSSL